MKQRNLLEHVDTYQSPYEAALNRKTDNALKRFNFEGMITQGMKAYTIEDLQRLSGDKSPFP